MTAESLHHCSQCKRRQPRSLMSKHTTRLNGLHGWCKECMNSRRRERKSTPEQRARWSLKTRYGLTVEAVDLMREGQGGVCAICRGPMDREVIDHDHATGNVRGLLCHPCNVKLHALDAWPHYQSALNYLQKASAERASASSGPGFRA